MVRSYIAGLLLSIPLLPKPSSSSMFLLSGISPTPDVFPQLSKVLFYLLKHPPLLFSLLWFKRPCSPSSVLFHSVFHLLVHVLYLIKKHAHGTPSYVNEILFLVMRLLYRAVLKALLKLGNLCLFFLLWSHLWFLLTL